MKTKLIQIQIKEMMLAGILALGFAGCSKDIRISIIQNAKRTLSGRGIASDSDITFDGESRRQYYEISDSELAGTKKVKDLVNATALVYDINFGGSNTSPNLNGIVYNNRVANQSFGFPLCTEDQVDAINRETGRSLSAPKYSNEGTNAGLACSGFLVAPDKILTAGHCLNIPSVPQSGDILRESASESDRDYCRNNIRFAFGYRHEGGNDRNTDFGPDDIYKCNEIVSLRHHSELANDPRYLPDSFGNYNFRGIDHFDYALIQLDRAVVQGSATTPRLPIALATPEEIEARRRNDRIISSGYPSGLSVKTDTDGKLHTSENGIIAYASDILGGNSGGPILDAQTGKAIGITSFQGGAFNSNFLDNVGYDYIPAFTFSHYANFGPTIELKPPVFGVASSGNLTLGDIDGISVPIAGVNVQRILLAARRKPGERDDVLFRNVALVLKNNSGGIIQTICVHGPDGSRDQFTSSFPRSFCDQFVRQDITGLGNLISLDVQADGVRKIEIKNHSFAFNAKTILIDYVGLYGAAATGSACVVERDCDSQTLFNRFDPLYDLNCNREFASEVESARQALLNVPKKVRFLHSAGSESVITGISGDAGQIPVHWNRLPSTTNVIDLEVELFQFNPYRPNERCRPEQKVISIAGLSRYLNTITFRNGMLGLTDEVRPGHYTVRVKSRYTDQNRVVRTAASKCIGTYRVTAALPESEGQNGCEFATYHVSNLWFGSIELHKSILDYDVIIPAHGKVREVRLGRSLNFAPKSADEILHFTNKGGTGSASEAAWQEGARDMQVTRLICPGKGQAIEVLIQDVDEPNGNNSDFRAVFWSEGLDSAGEHIIRGKGFQRVNGGAESMTDLEGISLHR